MTVEEAMDECEALIRFYRRRGWTFLSALEFTVRKFSGSWPEPRRPYSRAGRPRGEGRLPKEQISNAQQPE